MLSNMTETCTPIIRQYWTLIKNSTTSRLNANLNEIKYLKKKKKKTARQNPNQKVNNTKMQEKVEQG